MKSKYPLLGSTEPRHLVVVAVSDWKRHEGGVWEHMVATEHEDFNGASTSSYQISEVDLDAAYQEGGMKSIMNLIAEKQRWAMDSVASRSE